MMYGVLPKVTKWLRGDVWGYIKQYPSRVALSFGSAFFSSYYLLFATERLLLKSRIQFGVFVPEDETCTIRNFKATHASAKLQEIMSPEACAAAYYVVTGGFGVGKSSSARYSADALGHSGIMYVKVPPNGSIKDFEDSLARRLFLYHLSHDRFCASLRFLPGLFLFGIPYYSGDTKESYLLTLLQTLKVLSKQYGRWHGGKSVVLVIDHLENFLNSDEEGMHYATILQDTAKYLAVSKRLISCCAVSVSYDICRMWGPLKWCLSQAKERCFQCCAAEVPAVVQCSLNSVKLQMRRPWNI
jgi:hypothetical protein